MSLRSIIGLLLVVGLLALGGARQATPAHATTTTNPTSTSTASLYLSNWSNVMAIWMASKLNQNDTGTYGPRIAELRYSNQWSTNQLNDYSGFFRDETASVKYDQIHNFNSTGYLDESGDCVWPGRRHARRLPNGDVAPGRQRRRLQWRTHDRGRLVPVRLKRRALEQQQHLHTERRPRLPKPGHSARERKHDPLLLSRARLVTDQRAVCRRHRTGTDRQLLV